MTGKVVLHLLLLISYILLGQTDQVSSRLFIEVDSVITSKMEEYDIPGLSIGIVQSGSIIYQRGYGVASITSETKVNENTIFHTASISKLFTAEAIRKLAASDSISLDDIVADIAPELSFANSNAMSIQVRHLMSHTSGLPDIRNYEWSKRQQSPDALKKYVLALNLKSSFKPGTQYKYSNLGYEILGYLVEKISGQNFDEYLKDEILVPAEMKVSDYRYFLIPDEMKTRPHSKKGSEVYIRKHYPYNRKHAPSSTLNASSKELSKWMLKFFSTADLKDDDQLLGFQQYDFKDFKAIGHFGGDKGFRSFLMMIPEHEMGLVVLANCDYKEDFRQEILVSIARKIISSNR